MPDRIALVDAFADAPFAGNPAAVCLLAGPREVGWMQALARELNQPATAFVAEEGDGFALRWFAPTVELALCGHGTLAAAHLLWDEGRVAPGEPVRFTTGAGALVCRHEAGWVAMDFPAEVAEPVAEPPADLLRALGVAPRAVGRNRLDYLVELADADAVRAARPDFALLRTIPTRGAIVTAPADDGAHDFVSRFFAPSAGLPEDAVTGSAHCALGPHWAARLGRDDLLGRQLSARGGTVRVRPRGARVALLGRATTVLRGELVP